MSDNKYAVPALERANAVLLELARHPGQYRLIDLSRLLGIHKSSMYCLLHTMEVLQWVVKEKNDTYALGPAIGMLGGTYFRQQALVDRFRREAAATRDRVGETVQLARFEGSDIYYLEKLEAPGPVRIASDPGMRLPAHATALGKALLAQLDDGEISSRLADPLPRLTPNTRGTVRELLRELARVREQGTAVDREEAVLGFCCVAAPVFGGDGRAAAAVSVSMPRHHWDDKRDLAIREIRALAARLSGGSREP